ncbi:predicted protein [Postia placenta Mad-698-R]|uniref:Uncharacterized protein n=1 Tax=Postia placenta MAD-698-R-SB12 TaxID=670580 RepID=A0A1X6MQX0_9APHY|nr:hypothetical protein POSPLADRAFT_1153044 [Postia placenta MAD-698-R-SB12]EED83449.1 predicted protein [Postia placenta Mad-698-R]OSX58679.1 hypothetical protein POSPLADRAFT_1153044 [Postia placenta MAD-698-R-SB12]
MIEFTGVDWILTPKAQHVIVIANISVHSEMQHSGYHPEVVMTYSFDNQLMAGLTLHKINVIMSTQSVNITHVAQVRCYRGQCRDLGSSDRGEFESWGCSTDLTEAMGQEVETEVPRAAEAGLYIGEDKGRLCALVRAQLVRAQHADAAPGAGVWQSAELAEAKVCTFLSYELGNHLVSWANAANKLPRASEETQVAMSQLEVKRQGKTKQDAGGVDATYETLTPNLGAT